MLTEKQAYKLKKKEQEKILKDANIKGKELKELNLEKERVDKILEIQCIHCGFFLRKISESSDVINYQCPNCHAQRSINKSTFGGK